MYDALMMYKIGAQGRVGWQESGTGASRAVTMYYAVCICTISSRAPTDALGTLGVPYTPP